MRYKISLIFSKKEIIDLQQISELKNFFNISCKKEPDLECIVTNSHCHSQTRYFNGNTLFFFLKTTLPEYI